ncbi:hypothetical protein LAD54_19960 [Klebsiella pneumoniae]|nr:hypothetical protein [Klebsiella pneumoniae]
MKNVSTASSTQNHTSATDSEREKAALLMHPRFGFVYGADPVRLPGPARLPAGFAADLGHRHLKDRGEALQGLSKPRRSPFSMRDRAR